MTEDDLIVGLMGALAAGGWRFQHVRRSDLGIVQGHRGLPDLIAVHPERGALLMLECKSDPGWLDPEQRAWVEGLRAAGVDARVVRPNDYDALVGELVGDRLLRRNGPGGRSCEPLPRCRGEGSAGSCPGDPERV